MDLEIFIGRFHPVFVHLPIGFILMAILLEVIGKRTKKRDKYQAAIVVSLGLGALTGIIAIMTGWLLAGGGEYNASALSFHKWLAIVTVLATSVLFFIQKFNRETTFSKSGVVLFSLFGLLSITGHLGGNLTHGADYLVEYAPNFIQKIAGYDKKEIVNLTDKSTDSILVYPHLIQPIFENKCYSCHSKEKQSGDLDLTVAKNLFEPINSHPVVVAGDPFGSELYRRLTLPHTHKKYMPPTGNPLNFTDIQIIKKWIELGADTTSIFQPEDLNPELAKAILRDYGLDYSKKPYVEKVKITPIDSEKKLKLTELGFSVKSLGLGIHLLDVHFSGDFSKEHGLALNAAANKITWLKISETDFQDVPIDLEKFEHLTRLDFYKSSFSDSIFDKIDQLQHLESINLYGTNAGDALLEKLKNVPSLARLYVADSDISEMGIELFGEVRIEVEVID